jgi:hypothetical protein
VRDRSCGTRTRPSRAERGQRFLCGGQGGLDGFGGGSQVTVTVTVSVSVGPGTVVVTAGADTVVVGPATVVVVVGPGTVVVTVGPRTVVVTAGPGEDTVSAPAVIAVVTAGPVTVVVVERPGTVTKTVVTGAGPTSPEAPPGAVGCPGTVVVSVTICSSPGIVRVLVVHTTSCSVLPTVPWAIVPIAPTPRRYATSRIKGASRS